jgi:hypothetical protein
VNRLLAQSGFSPIEDQWRYEVLGAESSYGEKSKAASAREIVLRLVATHDQKEALNLLSKEIAPMSTSMAPGLINMLGGRSKPQPWIKLFSCLYPKHKVALSTVMDQTQAIELPEQKVFQQNVNAALPQAVPVEDAISVPLIDLAVARSGDKGNHANVGVIARDPKYLPYIVSSLSKAAVQECFKHYWQEESSVEIWHLPGCAALNILLENVLAGGGMASLQVDAQGKGFAQQILEMPIQVPKDL